MRHSIGKFHHWLLRRIFRRLVIQGTSHQRNITEVFRLLAVASRAEFYEDNDVTQRTFLESLFEHALNATFGRS